MEGQSTELEIRRARTQDITFVMDIAKEVHQMVVVRRGHEAGLCPEFERIHDSYEEALRGPHVGFFVGLMCGHVAGYVLASVDDSPDDLTNVPRVRIDELAVGSGHRRRGVGRALLERVENWAGELGLTLVQLAVWEFNDEALALYHCTGYQTIMRKMEKAIVVPSPDSGKKPPNPL